MTDQPPGADKVPRPIVWIYDRSTPVEQVDRLGGQLSRWWSAANRQLGRVLDAEAQQITRENDAFFLILAVRQCLGIADRLAGILAEHGSAGPAAAVVAFEGAQPSLVDLRDVLVHIDEYEVGVGDRRKSVKSANGVTLYSEARDDAYLLIVLSDRGLRVTVDLLDAYRAAGTLCSVVMQGALDMQGQPAHRGDRG